MKISNLRPLLRAFYTFLTAIVVVWAMPRNAQAQLYVTQETSPGVVSVYDAPTGELINATFITGPTGRTGGSPAALAVSGNTLFVGNAGFSAGSGTVDEYNATTGAPINVPFITGLAFGSPQSVVLRGNTLFVADTNNSTVNEYNATTGAPIKVPFITGLMRPFGLALRNNTLFVAIFISGTVGEYDANTGAPIKVPFITGQHGLTGLALRGNTLFVANLFQNTVGEYDATTGALINEITAGLDGPQGLALLGNTLFVANSGGGTVGEYDATTGALIKANFIEGLDFPIGIAVSSTVRFAAFSAKLESLSKTFQLTGAFTLDPDSIGINPVKENVTLRIGTVSFKIPPGSFNRKPDGTFFFTGTADQGISQAQIVPLGNNMFTYSFTGAGVDLTPLSEVKVGLTIETDTGTTRVIVSL